jgi:site-specific recombinase
MPSLSCWVRRLPGVQPDFLDAAEGLAAWLAELERRIATRSHELAELHERPEDSRSRIASLSANKWTAVHIQEAQTAAAAVEKDGLRPAMAAGRSPSSTAHN